MTENTRTASYIGLALVLLVVAALVNRKPEIETAEALAGKILFPALKSPDDVGGLEIVTSADGVAQTEFTVKRDADGWTLPSHGGYPADAEKQVASATSSLVDLKALAVVTTSPSQHAEYGVVDPEKASPGAVGIGKLVKVLDKSGNPLARLVIGKKDADASSNGSDTGGSELWFVRALPADVVYRVALPTAKYSTSFEDWIETDLLKIDPWTIRNVTLKDYTFDIGRDLTGQVAQSYDQLSTIDLAFDEKASKWNLEKLVVFENDQPKPVELGANEELNSTRLNEMKTALDDLKIVGVRAKPAGLSANLKADKNIFADTQAIQSLADRGFYAVRGEGGQPEILSSDGEVLVQLQDGVEYTLRFGGVAGVADSATDGAAGNENKAGTDKKDSPGATLNRFIMVSARFNKDLIPDPDLAPVPGESVEKAEGADTSPADQADKSEADQADKSQADQADTVEPAKTEASNAKTETKDAPAQDEAKTPADKKEPAGKEAAKSSDDAAASKDGDKSAAVEAAETLHFVKLQDATADSDDAKQAKGAKSPQSTGDESQTKAADKAADKSDDTKTSKKATEAATKDAASKDAAKKNAAAKDDAATKAAEPPAEGDAAKADAAKADEKEPTPDNEEDLALRRKQVQTENERKQKEYDEKIKKGEAKAQELNARFAGWYYVVSEDTYKKIHLNRDDVIKAKVEANADGTSADGANTDPLKVPPLSTDLLPPPDAAVKENEE